MTPILKSLREQRRLAGVDPLRARPRVRTSTACFTCHSGYGIWGGVDAKMAGVMHMVRAATGWYTLPITLNGPFDIDSCLGCHAMAASFRAVEAHQDPDLQKQLLSRELSCTGACHPAAHPESALTGGVAGVMMRLACFLGLIALAALALLVVRLDGATATIFSFVGCPALGIALALYAFAAGAPARFALAPPSGPE